MDKPRAVEDLDVFKRAYRISLEVHRKSLNLPSIEQYALGIRSGGRARRSAPTSPKDLVARRPRRRSSSALS
jgi:hypothetical protein